MNVKIEYIYPATSLQQGFIYHALSQPKDDAYRVQQLYDYHEPLDVDKYLQAWRNCISEYPILRTAFNWEEDIIQVIYKEGNLEHSTVDISDLASQEEKDAAIERIQIEDRKRGFDLSSPTLLRLCIIKQSKDCYTILRTTHHSIIDGWSGPVLSSKLHWYYQLLLDNKTISIKEDTAYLSAQEYIFRHKRDIHEYWDKTLRGIEGANDINALLSDPIDFSSYKQVEQAATNVLEISGALYNELKSFIKKEGVTINVVVQFVWHKLLQVYSGNKQSIVGTTISGRDIPVEDIENSVGLYINTLPLIIDWDNNETISFQLQDIQKRITQMNTHSFADLAKLQINGERIFHNLFVFENYPAPKGSDKKALKVIGRKTIEKVNYPLSIMAYEYSDRLIIKLGYDGMYLRGDKAQGHLIAMEHLVDQLISNPHKSHKEMSVLLPAEYNKMVYEWNATDKDYPKDKTIYALFESQVEKTPNAVALVYEGDELSYKELNERSNQLARHIRLEYSNRSGKELQGDTLIALCLDRSLEMVIGILAVLKSGGAYVPIDPEYPQDRIDYILEDTGSLLVLSQKHLLGKEGHDLPAEKVLLIDLDEVIYQGTDSSNLPQYSGAKNLAYVIYTSGTTGRPKGVMIEHRGVVNYLHAQNHFLESPSSKRFYLLHSYAFDTSISCIFGAICFSNTVVISNYFERMSKKIFNLYDIDIAYIPPALLASLEYSDLLSLNTIVVSGELSDPEILKKFSRIKIINEYGPTEATVGATYYEISDNYLVNIAGKSLVNTKAYVLDPNNLPVPVGVIGELHIGGAGLARGYLNREDLTSERFIGNPFATDADKSKGYDRLYKTGDLVRWLVDGNLEYIGRNDDQVKIRGYRIELGEIEHALSSIAGISQSSVLVRERETSGGIIKSLVGYYVAEEGDSNLDQGMILEQLSAVLPEYMIPGVLIAMDSFPLTINGKLDKRSLPDPDFSVAAEDYQAPSTAMEILVCGIWQEVLGLERVGVTDNFFRIGGNSILAIQVSHRMSSALGCYIKIADIFKYKTILDLLAHNVESIEAVIPKTAEKQSILSFSQERLWFIEQYEQGTNAYHMPRVLELDQATDIAGIKYALEGIVWRHEILRSTIEQSEDLDHGIQVVHDKALFIEEIRLGAEEDYESVIKSDINRPFDLSLEYPIRAKFYTVESESGGERRFLLINIHHIASDGWSMNIFQRELLSYYKGYIDGDKAFALPALDIQYKDFAVWQRNYLSGEVLENQLGYWKSKLTGYVPLEFPTDHLRPSQIDYRGSHQNFVLSKEVSEQLRLLAQRLGVTLHSVMLSSINILLGKYTGQDDIVIGSPIANRHHRQTQDLIGFFVNTQVNRTILSKGQSYVSLIDQVHQDQIEGQLHQDLPFEKLVEELGVDRDASRHPIFQVMFVVESSNTDREVHTQEISSFKPVYFEGSYEVEKFDLSIFIDDSQESLMGSVGYAVSLFDKDTIERFIGHYEHLLAELVKAPEQCYDQISLLLPSEHQEMVYDWNATDKDYPQDKTIYELFQAQAESTPDSVALVYEGQELSYRELNERSNQLARHIRCEYQKRTQEALRADSLIALCLDRSLEMVIGILAVLKSGGAYVPIDPEYPQDRIDYILEDTGAVLVLSQKHLLNKEDLQLPKDKVIAIDLGGSIYDGQDISNLPQHSGAKNLAYVIYTSGTTGRPKGVMIEQDAVLSLVYNDYINIASKDIFALVSSPVFDAATFEIWTPLLNGNVLVIPKDVQSIISDVNIFNRFLTVNEISILWLTKTLFESLYYLNNPIFENLNYLIIGGEALDKRSVNALINSGRRPNYLINGYGPTESTTFTCTYGIENSIESYSIPIGMPINNRKAYVLDTNHQPVPVGVIGELHIGGAGLARGYLNREDLTAERFMGNPFASASDKLKGYDRLYKTGDLVRWLPDGNLEYMGRNDDQVKIRGYRIELGEIEHALSSIAGISQSSVMVRERETSGGIIKSLVGYYVAEEGDLDLDQGMILEQLSAVLPEYMIPGVLIAMDSFPLTINGKLDKRSLPDPDFSVAAEDYQAPSTAMEILVCGIWQEVLGLERVGVTDNFFRIGGNSILAIQVSHRMSSALGCYIKIADIFKYKTILDLLAHNVESIEAVIPKTAEKQSILSFSQERLWFIEQYEQGTNAYHMPRVLELDQAADIAGIKYALEGIVSRHGILRSTIEQSEDLDHGIQVVHDKALFIEEIRLGAEEDYESVIKSDINRPFDLSLEYPIRAKFYTVESESGGERRFLLINMHHIASDGWSMDIFQRELLSYYKGYIDGDKAFALPALDIQYKDFAVWQRNYLSGEVLENQLGYWKSKLTGYVPLEFPTDHLRPSQIDYRGSHQNFVLSKDLSDQLRLLAQRLGVTLHSVMLSSINILLGKYTGQDDIIIGSPIANRHHRQTEGLIGFFVNTQVNRSILSKGESYVSLIDQVHQNQIEGQLHQDLPFEKLVEELGVDRDASRHPIFQVMFVVESSNTDREVHTQEISSFKPVYFEGSYEVEKFDLSIFIDGSQPELMGSVSYATSLFDKDTIDRFIGHYKNLLAELLKAPEQCYDQISLLLPSEYKEMVYDWNATDKDYPQDKTIYELFQAQAESTPDSVALVYDGQELSYRELNERSNQLARHIRCEYQKRTQEALRADSLIALCLDRSLEMVIGILAVLKSGGAYVPIDPEYPQERVDYILEDTGAVLVLSQKHLLDKEDLQLPKDKVITIDLGGSIYDGQDSSNLPQHSGAKNLAYVIYTSGTTGRPKGVMIEHTGIVNLVYIQKDDLEINDQSKILQYASTIFDASVWEIFSSLSFGASLYILPSILRQDVQLLANYIEDNRINVALLPPILLSIISHTDQFKSLGILLVGGDLSSRGLMEKWSKGRRLINAYGPTENTVCVTMHLYEDGDLNTNIGKPLSNMSTYVLDQNRQPVPIGVIGELHIGGAGLARGYLNRDDLTSERFITNAFATDTDLSKGYDRLYKTGDLVRWLPDGNLEYIGRNDDQVKIRGYRIELGEIEHALSSISGIAQSCVLVKERETSSGVVKSLVGYYVADGGDSDLDQAVILEELSKMLPEYMVPGALVGMDSFPLTINGKLDKRSLPDPDFSNTLEQYVAPGTGLETVISSIWQEVLGLERVGVTDKFFRLGGNSILSIQLKQKLNKLKEFKDIGIADLFKNDTIAKLISSINNDQQTNYKLQNNIYKSGNHEIAIIGVSGEFSGVKNLDDYWQLIVNQKEGVQFFTREECKDKGVKETLVENENYVPVAGLIENIELFDPLFWGISPNEAKQLDPQIRKFIEHCWFALEASGYSNNHKDLITGIIAGSGSNNYYNNIVNSEMADEINMWDVSASNSKDALTTKTAFFLGLSGPANSINTACSTSLVSVVEGCQKLQLGVCDMVLAGGVSLSMPDQIGYVYNEGMILSKDGHCRAFDADASGTIGGSGVGVVVLKRLEDAIKDNDNIIGVIKGYATNNDGDRKIGYTAPSIIGQSECIINAQINAGITSDEVDYVECHGTATSIGDPIEIQALGEAFTYNIDKLKKIDKKTILGSVKANIGHANSAAGIAGLLKVCNMLQNSVIPGQTNFSIINPELYLDKTNFSISTTNKEWIANPNKQRIAGVSSFGIGGTNAHLVIGDYNPKKEKLNKIKNDQFIVDNKDLLQNYIILFSAKSRKSLENYKLLFREYLKGINKADDLEKIKNIAFTLQEKRKHFEYRSAYRVTSKEELISKLNVDLSYIQTTVEENSKIVFMFPGQGAQYTQMAKELYDNEPHIRSVIDKCINLANNYLDIDLYKVIYPSENILHYDINEIQFTPISLFIIEYSLAKHLEYLGVHANAYIGHSFGEYVAATLAGVFDLEDAIKIVIVRSKLMQLMEHGSMLSVNAEEHIIKEIVETYNCEIAVINSHEDIVISGTIIDIEKLQKALEKQNIPVVRLKTSHAGHSKMMEKAAKEFENEFKQIKLNAPKKLFVSNLTGEIATDEVSTAAYWCRHLRNTVLFSKGIDRLSKEYNYQVNFIEVGVGKGLSSFVNKYKNANNYKKIQSLQLLPSAKEVNENDEYYQKIEFKEDIKAKLWMSGIIDNPNEVKLFNETKLITDIPRYQFDYQNCWIRKADLPNVKTFNSLEDICYERSWERSDIIKRNNTFSKNIEYKNILILINENIVEDDTYELLNLLRNNYDNTNYAIHQSSNNIDTEFIFDFNCKSHIGKILDEKNKIGEIDVIIYVSSSVDLLNPALDIFALRNVFEWSKQTGIKIPKIISISFDNYEVIGSELLKEKPSIVYGVIKSIPHEYFTSNTKTFHIDLSSKDSNYINSLLSVLEQNVDNELVVIRDKYYWTPTYKKVKRIDIKDKKHNLNGKDSVFLITGGLGALGYAYAKHLSNNTNQCTLILIGRTIEANLREDYKDRLDDLRKTKHNIIYTAIDIGDSEAENALKQILRINSVSNIDVVLHTAVVVAQSALNDKSNNDIEQVLNPKVIGIENLLKLAKFVPINNLVSCSSLTSIIPSLGNMEYTVANLYLDEISYRNHFNIDSILSVNINQVSDAGAAVEFIENSITKRGKTSNSIRSQEFPIILENLLMDNHQKNICISRFDIQIGFKDNFKFLDIQNERSETFTNVKLVEKDFSDIEYNIAKIFGEVLGVEEISVQDDFFKIGGNSISAIKVSHLMSKTFECDVWVSDLFKHRTIKNLKEILFKTTTVKGELWEI